MSDFSDDLDAWALRYRSGPSASPIPGPMIRPKRGHGMTSAQLIGRRRWGATSAHRGVYRLGSGRYEAKLRRDGKIIHFGTFDSEDEAAGAIKAYLEAR